MESKNKSLMGGLVKLFIIVFIVATIVLVFHFTNLSINDFRPENIRIFIQKFGGFAPLIFMLIYSLRAVILVLPVGVMSLAGGLAFGKWLGTLYILIGATAGSCLSFLMARYIGRGFIEKLGVMKKGKLKSFDEGVEKNGFRLILFMRLIPLFQYDAVNFGAGFSKMKFRDYAIGSFIGMIPGGFINAMLGSSLDNIISTQFFVALGCFFLLMFSPTIFKAIKKRKEAKIEVAEVIEINGSCPGCSGKIGALAILIAWDKWGTFICPACEKRIAFRYWLLAVTLLFGLFIGVERLLHHLVVIQFPLWLSFLISFVLSVLIMMFIPMVWRYKIEAFRS